MGDVGEPQLANLSPEKSDIKTVLEVPILLIFAVTNAGRDICWHQF